MKKSIVTILIVALAIALGTGLVFAASSPEASYAKVAGWNCAGGAGCGYVDADGDGVCDNYGTAACNHSGAAAGAQAYFTPTSALSIDINPSIQLDINRFDKVISAQGFNQAGQAILDQTDVKYMSYDEAIDAILSAAEEAGYLESSSNVSIAAAGESEQCGRLLTGAEECAGRHSGNVSCYSGTQEDLHCAHDYGMSLGRYNAYLILKELDPSVTPEQVQNMSMREIYDMIESLGGSAPSGSGSGGGQSGEGHHGHMGGHQ